MAGPGWQRDDLFEMKEPKPGEEHAQGESLLLFGDLLGGGAVASDRYHHVFKNHPPSYKALCSAWGLPFRVKLA